MLELDEKGFPQLTSLDLAVFSPSTAKDGRGNDFHNAATGRFTHTPSGVQVLEGDNLLKGLTTPTRKVLFDRAKATLANQVSARIIEGRLHIVLLKDGRRLDSFAIEPKANRDAAKTETNEEEGEKLDDTDSVIRDALLDAARDLNLTGKKLYAFIAEAIGRPLTDSEKRNVENQVRARRIDDLVSYLHRQLQKKEKGITEKDTIRVSAPRGYLRKTFSMFSVEDAREVYDRLRNLGWDEGTVQQHVADKMPKKLKDAINVTHEETNPDDD